MKKVIIMTLLSLGLLSPAWALNLDEAKSQGLVGELASGYLGVVKNSAGSKKLVNEINQKRKSLYKNISKKTGTSVKAVEIRAGKKAINKTRKGQYINIGNGWQRK